MSARQSIEPAHTELLVRVWREVATSVDLRDATEGVLTVLRSSLPLDSLAVRLIEREWSALDTLAVATRQGVSLPTHVPRTTLEGRTFNEVVEWVRGGAIVVARHGERGAVLESSRPVVPGHVLAGPLGGRADVFGLAAASRQGAPFDPRERDIFAAVLEPLSAALAITCACTN